MLPMYVKCCRSSKGNDDLQGMSTFCWSQQVVHNLKIMRWMTSLWEEFLMMNYTLILLLLLKMKQVFSAFGLWWHRGTVLFDGFCIWHHANRPAPFTYFYPFYELLRFPLRNQDCDTPCHWAGFFFFLLLFWYVIVDDVLWWLCPVQNGPPCALNGVMAMKQLTRCTCWNRYPLRGVFVSSTLQTSCSCEHKLLERSVWVRWIEQSTVMYCTMVYCTCRIVLLHWHQSILGPKHQVSHIRLTVLPMSISGNSASAIGFGTHW